MEYYYVDLQAGMIITANKFKNIKAAAVFNSKQAKHSKEHNNTNIIALSGDDTSKEEAIEIIQAWIETEFSNEERHSRRLQKIENLEK